MQQCVQFCPCRCMLQRMQVLLVLNFYISIIVPTNPRRASLAAAGGPTEPLLCVLSVEQLQEVSLIDINLGSEHMKLSQALCPPIMQIILESGLKANSGEKLTLIAGICTSELEL